MNKKEIEEALHELSALYKEYEPIAEYYSVEKDEWNFAVLAQIQGARSEILTFLIMYYFVLSEYDLNKYREGFNGSKKDALENIAKYKFKIDISLEITKSQYDGVLAFRDDLDDLIKSELKK